MEREDPARASIALERFSGYLGVVARLGLDPRLRGKFDPSDIVQETLLEAHRSIGRFQGTTFAQQAAWLRQILLQNLADAARRYHRAKRDVGRELSLEAQLEESSARLVRWLEAESSSPSHRASQEERKLLLAEALASLPDEEQEALVLRHCQGLTLIEISQALGKSRYAVARLLHRATVALRERLRKLE